MAFATHPDTLPHQDAPLLGSANCGHYPPPEFGVMRVSRQLLEIRGARLPGPGSLTYRLAVGCFNRDTPSLTTRGADQPNLFKPHDLKKRITPSVYPGSHRYCHLYPHSREYLALQTQVVDFSDSIPAVSGSLCGPFGIFFRWFTGSPPRLFRCLSAHQVPVLDCSRGYPVPSAPQWTSSSTHPTPIHLLLQPPSWVQL